MRELGVGWSIDPCERGCILETFGNDALLIYSIFCGSVKKGLNEKTKSHYFEIDYQALEFLARTHEIEDRQELLRLIHLIMDQYDCEMDEEEVLGLND